MNGKRPETYFPNVAEMYKSLKEDERILFDVETGYPYKVTKKYHDMYMELLKSTLPKGFSKPSGSIYMTGTGGDGFSKCSAEEMFYNPEKYNLKENGDSKAN